AERRRGGVRFFRSNAHDPAFPALFRHHAGHLSTPARVPFGGQDVERPPLSDKGLTVSVLRSPSLRLFGSKGPGERSGDQWVSVTATHLAAVCARCACNENHDFS